MSLSGHLHTMAAGHLLQWLSFGQKTGKLVIRNSSVEKTIFVQKGKIVSSASTDPREYLGQFLMSYGYIDEEELRKAMEVQEQSKILLGKILVIIEAITEADLRRLMKIKAEEEIYDVFLWPDGEFHFYDDQRPAMEFVPLHLDVNGIIMEGSRRVDEWDRIRKVITSSALIPATRKKVKISGLNEAQRKIIDLIDGQRTIEEIVLESRSSTFVVSSTIATLVESGAVETAEGAAPPEAPAVEAVVTPAESFLGSESEIASLLTRAQSGLREGDYEKSLRLLKAAQNLEPDSARVRSALKGAESVILAELKKNGIADQKVPHLVRPLEELSAMNFSPNEGFILSRINGQWDVSSITKVSPMREIDALLIFHKLVKDQIVELK
ncbi:MAG TPA: DUF4388 domain-containing protein [Thermoanaerobaculia bacterium]|nr:DUF4388 domain-containing protein [Thermoanaerobaculia bacterium]